MTNILPIPFSETLKLEIGLDGRPPIYSLDVEVASTPIQQFQNLSFRGYGNTFVEQKAYMLLINESKLATPMLLLLRDRDFECGFITFDSRHTFSSLGFLPTANGIVQSIRTFSESYVLLIPVYMVQNIAKKYPRLSQRNRLKLQIL